MASGSKKAAVILSEQLRGHVDRTEESEIVASGSKKAAIILPEQLRGHVNRTEESKIVASGSQKAAVILPEQLRGHVDGGADHGARDHGLRLTEAQVGQLGAVRVVQLEQSQRPLSGAYPARRDVLRGLKRYILNTDLIVCYAMSLGTVLTTKRF